MNTIYLSVAIILFPSQTRDIKQKAVFVVVSVFVQDGIYYSVADYNSSRVDVGCMSDVGCMLDVPVPFS